MSMSTQPSRRTFLADLTAQAALIGGGVGSVSNAHEHLTASTEGMEASSFFSRPSQVIRLEGSRPLALTVAPDDSLWIAIDRKVVLLDGDGQRQKEWRFLRTPRGLATDGQGQLYVALAQSIEVLDVATDRRAVWSCPTPDCWFSGLAYHGNQLFAADAAAGVVWRFDQQGRLLGSLIGDNGRFSVSREAFSLSAAAGQLHIAVPRRHQVAHIDLEGEQFSVWGADSRGVSGFSGCCNPVSLAARDDGSVLTVERGVPRVKLFSSRGEFMLLLAGPESFAQPPVEKGGEAGEACGGGDFAVASDSRGRILVLDQRARELRIFG